MTKNVGAKLPTSATATAGKQVSPKGSTRRSFMAVAGAALSAPVAAAVATAPFRLPASAGSDSPEERLARLEDLNAIRALNVAFANHVSAGEHDKLAAIVAAPTAIAREPGLCAIALEDYGERDVIEVAPDRQRATARLHVTLHTETEMGPDCTLVEMARQQGSAGIKQAEPAVLETTYVRGDNGWKILDVARAKV